MPFNLVSLASDMPTKKTSAASDMPLVKPPGISYVTPEETSIALHMPFIMAIASHMPFIKATCMAWVDWCHIPGRRSEDRA